MDGLLRCARYAFGPNRLHYCGPDARGEVAAYLASGQTDLGLDALLRQFRTLYPYLRLISQANHIANPFDEQVVEAYWIGNRLLEAVERQQLYRQLWEGQRLAQRLGGQEFDRLCGELRQGAVPHHSFHVLEVWRRTGHEGRALTLADLDECRVSWGQVERVDGPFLEVRTEPLAYVEEDLVLGPPTLRHLARKLESDYEVEQVKSGDLVTIHWGVPCEVVTPEQVANLQRYTLRHLQLANQTL